MSNKDIYIQNILRKYWGDECNIELAIYHNCSSKYIDKLEFGIGFPNLPYKCPNCGVIVNDYDNLRFDLIEVDFYE